MPERIGVALLGAVRHAGDYAPLLAAHPRLELVAVAEARDAAEPAQRLGRELALRHGVPFVATESALARADVELAVVTTEPARHAAAALGAIRAGKHVLVDKPCATSAAAARELAAAARGHRAVGAYVHRLFSPAIERLADDVATGALGVPRTLQLTWIATNAVEDEGGAVIVARALSGGGELWNFLGYPVDTVLWVTGLQPRRVFATATNVTSAIHAEHGVESLATVSIELDGGVRASIAVGRGRGRPGGGIFTATVVGSHGLVAVDEARPGVEPSAPGLLPDPAEDLFEITFNRLLDDVVAAIDGGGAVRRSLADGCELALVIAAADESARTGAAVTL